MSLTSACASCFGHAIVKPLQTTETTALPHHPSPLNKYMSHMFFFFFFLHMNDCTYVMPYVLMTRPKQVFLPSSTIFAIWHRHCHLAPSWPPCILPLFLVTCYATLYPALSVRPSVRPSVGRLVGPHFTFFMYLRSLASLLLAKCFSNSNTVPAHPHVTEVAVNPALFLNFRYQRQRICIIVCLLKKEHNCKYGNVNQYCCCSTVPFLDFFRDYMHS